MKKLLAAPLAASIVIADQATKYLADRFISPAQGVKLLPFLDLVNVKNKGAAFGLFSSLGNTFFIIVSILAICFVIFLIVKDRENVLGLSLILGGAAGNLIDRFVLGQVRDFIDVYAGTYHWPAFNVADSCLTVGIGLLIVMPLLRKKG